MVERLSAKQLAQNRTEYLEIVNNTFECDTDNLLNWFENSDFWEAPASTKYHDSYQGGLVQHHLQVYRELMLLNYTKMLNLGEVSIARTALLHDICKVDFYRMGRKNKKLDDGRWITVDQFEVNDENPLGHGEKSAILALKHQIPLTDDEIRAIRWHMGSYGPESKDYIGMQALSAAMNKTPLVVALQLADMMATYFK